MEPTWFEIMKQEEEESWDHFNEPSYLVLLKSKKNHNALNKISIKCT
ncbi:hypothetical protein TcasGA2_TC031220 [Tribolium castaneum]|uniref:Uncharacterized protein n=1 Tax=Tribolium castaneum TaxID=7070 RepID=A0A139W9Z5_TRICA|nr:hypothetical protein TcasGA2_TC031220 [Tribolium castaneum]